jgi:hypothetical protein
LKQIVVEMSVVGRHGIMRRQVATVESLHPAGPNTGEPGYRQVRYLGEGLLVFTRDI